MPIDAVLICWFRSRQAAAVQVIEDAKLHVLPFSLNRQTGTRPAVIVSISSISRHGNMGQSNYSAAKAAIVADTKLWSLELARYGIRTGAIAPGFTRTPILEGMRPDALEKMVAPVPLRRMGEPEEMYKTVKFIFENDYFTGRCVDVDGGLIL